MLRNPCFILFIYCCRIKLEISAQRSHFQLTGDYFYLNFWFLLRINLQSSGLLSTSLPFSLSGLWNKPFSAPKTKTKQKNKLAHPYKCWKLQQIVQHFPMTSKLFSFHRSWDLVLGQIDKFRLKCMIRQQFTISSSFLQVKFPGWEYSRKGLSPC